MFAECHLGWRAQNSDVSLTSDQDQNCLHRTSSGFRSHVLLIKVGTVFVLLPIGLATR